MYTAVGTIESVHMVRWGMTVSDVRKNLFALVKQVGVSGRSVEFCYEDQVFQLAPKEPRSKLDRIKPVPLLAHPNALEGAEEEIREEMNREWHKDWADL